MNGLREAPGFPDDAPGGILSRRRARSSYHPKEIEPVYWL